MTSVSSPPPPPHTGGPRPSDWSSNNSSSRGSAFRGTGRGRGRGRGGPPRGGSSSGGASRRGTGTKSDQPASDPAPTTTTTTTDKAPSAASAQKAPSVKIDVKSAANGDSPVTKKKQPASSPVRSAPAVSVAKPVVSVDTSTSSRSRRRAPPVQTPKAVAEPVATSPSSPDTPRGPAAGGASGRSQRRRRAKAPSISTPKAPVLAATMVTTQPQPKSPVIEPTTPAVPAPAPAPAPAAAAAVAAKKDAPPHLAVKSAPVPAKDVLRLDSLVEHVRAMAMDHARPTTPGTPAHIDWAGEDDDSLPDLDDWGVTSTTTASVTDSHLSALDDKQLLSPLLDGALKGLPLHERSPNATQTTLAPTLPSDPEPTTAVEGMGSAVPIVTVNAPNGDSSTPLRPAAKRDGAPSTHAHKVYPHPAKPRNYAVPSPLTSVARTNRANGSPSPSLVPASAGSQSETAKPPTETPQAETTSDRTSHAPGLEASIHAPNNAKADPASPRSAPPFNPSHGRSHTTGRQGFTGEGAFVGRGMRPGGAGGSAPVHHGRTQSTPPAASAAGHGPGHARHASRPVITGAAISRLARTLGSAVPRKESGVVAPGANAAGNAAAPAAANSTA